MDEITFKLAEQAADAPTATAILGPFFRHDTPHRKNGDNMVTGVDDGEMVFMHGRVVDFVTKKPLVGAVVEAWEASTNGLYEQQDPNQVEHNLRGKFTTDADGRYYFYCLRPTPYPVPDDGMCSPYTVVTAWSDTGCSFRPRWKAIGTYGQASIPSCTHPSPGKMTS